MAPDIRLDKYVQRKINRGREFYFFRKVVDGKERRWHLPHPFDDGYRRAYEHAWLDCFGVPREIDTSGLSVTDLCKRYESNFITSKAKPLPYYKARASDLLLKKWGKFEAFEIKALHMQALYDSMSAKPQVANRVFDDISAIFQWGIPRGFSETNPAKAVDRTKSGQSYEPWPDWAIEKFMAEAKWHIARAFIVGLYTGQRRGDVLSMRFQNIRNNVWHLKQSKTGNPVPIPLHPAVASIVANEWDWGKSQKIVDLSRPVLRNSKGLPWKSGFGASWSKELKRLKLDNNSPRLTYHGLRTTNATLIASAVAQRPDKFGGIERVKSLLGHLSDDMAKHYARRAEQEHLNNDSIVSMPDFGNRLK